MDDHATASRTRTSTLLSAAQTELDKLRFAVHAHSPEQDLAIAHLVFNALDEGVLVQGPLGRIAIANPAAARILGVDIEELIGGDVRDLAQPAIQADGSVLAQHQLPGQLAVSTREPQLGVLLGLADEDDGTVRWLEVNSRPLMSGGEVFAVVSSIRDVTERRRAEEALRNAERRQRVVLEHAVGGYAILGDDGRLIDGSAELYGWWERRQSNHMTIGFDSLHADDRSSGWRIIEQAKASPGTPQRSELRVINEMDETTRWIEFTATDQRGDPAVGGIVVNFTDITDRKLADEALAHQALHDPVTGLPNRRLLADGLADALARAVASESLVAVLFFDVDHFKLVNDSLGHPAGDRVLQELAGRFQAGARDGDMVVRFGGDEFVVVCEGLHSVDEALEVAHGLTARMEEPFLIDRAERIVTISAGVAISEPGATESSLLRDADAAMNLAKERGRARVELFSAELRSQATRRLNLTTALRHALSRDEFRLVYQPVVVAETGRPVGCEALLRWEHPKLGSVSPAEFITLAERSGLIVPIGTWVLRQALEQLDAWHRQRPGEDDLWVAINLSARQLNAPDLVEVVSKALSETGLDAECVHLEVTESSLVDDLAGSIERLRQLKDLGVHIDVDDFGTGYSSLSYLKRLPIDTLKIDRTFIDGLGTDPDDTAIVRAIVSLGQALDLDLIAEGVETGIQLAELQLLGCGLAQGFHWSKPLPPDEFIDWLADSIR